MSQEWNVNRVDVDIQIEQPQRPVVQRAGSAGESRPACTSSEAVLTALPSRSGLRAHRRRRLRHALAVRAAGRGPTPTGTGAGGPGSAGTMIHSEALSDSRSLVSTTAISELYVSVMIARRSARETLASLDDLERRDTTRVLADLGAAPGHDAPVRPRLDAADVEQRELPSCEDGVLSTSRPGFVPRPTGAVREASTSAGCTRSRSTLTAIVFPPVPRPDVRRPMTPRPLQGGRT